MAFFDVTTLQIYVGQFEDNTHLTKLRTLISQIRPVEVVHVKGEQGEDVLRMLKNQPVLPLFNAVHAAKSWSANKTVSKLERYIGGTYDKWSPFLLDLKTNREQQFSLALIALGLCINFLEENMIAD